MTKGFSIRISGRTQVAGVLNFKRILILTFSKLIIITYVSISFEFVLQCPRLIRLMAWHIYVIETMSIWVKFIWD